MLSSLPFLARILDGSGFDKYKPERGQTWLAERGIGRNNKMREVLGMALEAAALNPEIPRFNPGVLQT
jgi:hypothetical protein